MNGNIEKAVDDYIRRQYEEALAESQKLSSHPIINSNEEFGSWYYYNLKPLAFIILRSEILLDYESNEAKMPRRPREILSKKVLSRIAENYGIEEKLKKASNFYHRKFDGREADWVLVAAWLWIEMRDKDIDPVEFFSTRNIYEKSRKYILSMAERDIDPVFKEYFCNTEYSLLVDKYDISKDKLIEYVSKRELMSIGKDFRNRFEADSEKNDEQHRKFEEALKEFMAKYGIRPDVGSNKPGKSAAIRALNAAIEHIDAEWGYKALSYRRVDNEDCYVIEERCPQRMVINLIRNIKIEMNLDFDADDLHELLRKEKKNDKTGEIELTTLSKSTIENYMKPSSSKISRSE